VAILDRRGIVVNEKPNLKCGESKGAQHLTAHSLHLALAAVAMLAACSPDKPPAAVTFSNICQQEAKTRVAVEGYLRLPLIT
jgi:hypothetical protein